MGPPKLFLQQSPPSNSQPALLFSSSQLPSPLYCLRPHTGAGALGLGSRHLHSLQYSFLTGPPKLFSQQSPPSNSQPALLLPSSQLPSPLYFSWPQTGAGALGLGSRHLHSLQ